MLRHPPDLFIFRRAAIKVPTLFYRQQAATQQAIADGATLDNVRTRSQRAANSWTALADLQDRADAAHRAKVKAVAPPANESDETIDRAFARAAR